MFVKMSFACMLLFTMTLMACTPSTPQPNKTDSASSTITALNDRDEDPMVDDQHSNSDADNSTDSSAEPSVLRLASEDDEKPVWSDDITRSYLPKDDPRYQPILDAVNAMHANFRNARIRDNSIYGNLLFVHVDYELPRVGGAPIPQKIVAVILGSETIRLVELPDKELFAHFAGIIRSNPKILSQYKRIDIATFLTNGFYYEILSNGYAPSWKESGGKLSIRYHRMIYTDARLPYNERQQCTITVDSKQNFTQKCEKPVRVDASRRR
ncbi:MAG: hypothetical protein FWC40_07610 [Proteobacteria bacterium]|nr:hypothetical protein [Pseudomonadota bacterium]